MKTYKTEYFLGVKELTGYTVIKGKDAEKWLYAQGYKYLSVDNTGNIRSRSELSRVLDEMRVYSRAVIAR